MGDDGFTNPDFTLPVELERRIAETPSQFTTKGMFFQSLADRALASSGKPIGRGRYVPYKNYPFTEWLTLLVDCAERVHPQVSRREGMRRLGELAYPTFAESMVGRVILNLSGLDFVSAVKLIPRIYAVSGNSGTATLESLVGTRAIIALRDQADWPDAWHVGVFEGGMRAFGLKGVVRVRGVTRNGADLELTWK